MPPGLPLPPGTPLFSPPTLPHGMKEKKKYKLKAPLLKLHWDKVSARDLEKESLWVHMREEKFEDSALNTRLEELFSTRAPSEKRVSIINSSA